MNLNEILKNFDIETKVEAYGNGHINDTYLCASEYILQRINTKIFVNPEQVCNGAYRKENKTTGRRCIKRNTHGYSDQGRKAFL